MKEYRLVSLICSYNPKNYYVGQVIEELKKISKVYLFTTEEHSHDVEESYYFPKSIGPNLVYKPREWVINNLNKDWDFALYNEDDIFIPINSIKNVINLYNNLPKNLKPGFLRYEIDQQENKRYIDMHPAHSSHRAGDGSIKQVINDFNVWEAWNIHSGNWFFSKDDIKNLIDNQKFEISYRQYGFQYGSCIELESAATCLYFNYTKVYPFNFKSVECFHMPNKYVNIQGVGHLNPTEQELYFLIDKLK